MANTTLLYSKHGNCSVLGTLSVYNPYSNISYVTSRRAATNTDALEIENLHGEDTEILMEQLAEIQRLDRVDAFTDLRNQTVAQIAGMIEWRILNSNRFDCELCKEVLRSQQKISQTFLNSKRTIKPSQSTFDVCSTAEHFFKIELLKGQFKLITIQRAILSSLDYGTLYESDCFFHHSEHKLYLLKHIMNEYVRIKGVYLAKTYNFKQNQEFLRQKLTKLILNCNQ